MERLTLSDYCLHFFSAYNGKQNIHFECLKHYQDPILLVHTLLVQYGIGLEEIMSYNVRDFLTLHCPDF